MKRPLTLTRLMLRGHRAPLRSLALPHEDIAFEATDGVKLSGWFIPAAPERRPAIVLVHGWMWNRLGNVAGQTVVPDRDVDFVPAITALHEAGYHVLTYDWRRHGKSADGPGPLTYGPTEANDFRGALAYLRARADVDPERIGVIGTSAGGNVALYGSPGEDVKAILAIQPTRLTSFNTNFAKTELGRFGPLMIKPVDLLYALLRAPRPSKQDPAIPAARLEDTVVRYVQGTGDPWGELSVVREIAAATPHGEFMTYPSDGRYEGYAYISERADDVVAFFDAHV